MEDVLMVLKYSHYKVVGGASRRGQSVVLGGRWPTGVGWSVSGAGWCGLVSEGYFIQLTSQNR